MLIAVAPKGSESPIIPAKSTAPDPELIVKVSASPPVALTFPLILIPPSRVLLAAVSVSMVVFPTRDNGPVMVTVPKLSEASPTVLIFPFV